jgi:hypothetical protein
MIVGQYRRCISIWLPTSAWVASHTTPGRYKLVEHWEDSTFCNGCRRRIPWSWCAPAAEMHHQEDNNSTILQWAPNSHSLKFYGRQMRIPWSYMFSSSWDAPSGRSLDNLIVFSAAVLCLCFIGLCLCRIFFYVKCNRLEVCSHKFIQNQANNKENVSTRIHWWRKMWALSRLVRSHW